MTGAEVVQAIRERDREFAEACAGCRYTLGLWQEGQAFSAADVTGKRVLDWECGGGTWSALFVEMGAAEVVGVDSWLDTRQVERRLGKVPRLRFERRSLQEHARRRGRPFDLVFANTVTEHLADLPALLATCRELLAPGGLLFLNHDNYYQPVGSHDHGFLYYGKDGIEFQGPRCWEETGKCRVSADFRREVARRRPWTWDERTERQLSPEDCTQCPYYRRARPWAHLLYQAEFRRVFPQPCFTTGYSKSSLNKITPFMLRQFLIEAGFDLELWAPFVVPNEPPAELLAPPYSFSVEDLTTSTIAIRARPAASRSY